MTDKLVLTPEDDGVTHINIYSQGKTPEGRALSNFDHKPFVHKEFGAFASVEGFYYWLGCQDDRLRHAHGYEAKKLGQSLPVVKRWNQEKFESLIVEALGAKLDRYPDLAKRLAESTLPLTHYYAKYYDGKLKVTVPSNSDYMLAFFEEWRVQRNPQADCSAMARVASRKEKAAKAREADEAQMGLF